MWRADLDSLCKRAIVGAVSEGPAAETLEVLGETIHHPTVKGFGGVVFSVVVQEAGVESAQDIHKCIKRDVY